MPNLAQMRVEYGKLADDLAEIEKKHEGKDMPPSEGELAAQKASAAEALWKEIEQAERRQSIIAKSREIPAENAGLPAGPSAPESKGVGIDGSPVVGYMTMGEAFTGSEEYKGFIRGGFPRGQEPQMVFAKNMDTPLIEITQRMVEQKAVPVVGTGVIQADRIGLVQRLTQYDRLRIRDVLNVSQTDAPSVSYITENAVTLDATPVAESAAKPETTLELAEATSPVRTLAVHQPVTEQQLQDIPNIRNLMDTRMRYQLAKLEENQFMWGSGAGQNLTGILPLAGVAAITRTVTDTTNLDRIRIGITDVLINGYEPNAVCVHPTDWEAIVLLKATGKEYIWTVVTDPNTGQSRVFGLQVVETVAMKAPTTTQRYMLVGDFKMGATVWDRQQATAAVGWINAQFTTNQRTIRVEERLAFGVHAPAAFVKYETAAAV